MQLHTAKVRPFTAPTAYTLGQRAARLWFAGIAFSIVNSVYRLVDLRRREQLALKSRSSVSEKDSERRAELKLVKTCVSPSFLVSAPPCSSPVLTLS